MPFPGWTLPGVIGLAAATILMKSQGMLPGRRVVVAGCGPLLMAVAAKSSPVVEIWRRWLIWRDHPIGSQRCRGCCAVADFCAGSRLGARHRQGARSRLFPPWRTRGRRVRSRARVLIGPVDKAGAPAMGCEKAFSVDMLVVGHGLVASAEVPRLLRAGMTYDRLLGGWIPDVDPCGRTSVGGAVCDRRRGRNSWRRARGDRWSNSRRRGRPRCRANRG